MEGFTLCVGGKGRESLSLSERQQDKACTYTVPGTGTPGTPAGLAQAWTGKERREKLSVQDKIPTPSMCIRADVSLYSCGAKRGWGEKVEKFKYSLEKS